MEKHIKLEKTDIQNLINMLNEQAKYVNKLYLQMSVLDFPEKINTPTQSLAGAEPLKVGLIREVCGSKRNAACGRCKVDAAVPAGAGLGACCAGSHK